jgi:hypothetical protein
MRLTLERYRDLSRNLGLRVEELSVALRETACAPLRLIASGPLPENGPYLWGHYFFQQRNCVFGIASVESAW